MELITLKSSIRHINFTFVILFICFLVFAYALIENLSRPLDDAFISFRYAQNLASGYGLVFNQGEFVEGYTNFLWVVLSSVAIRVGLDPLSFSVTLGIFSYLLSIALVLLSLKKYAPNNLANLTVALAGVLLILPHSLLGFVGTGLETAFVGVLLLAAILSETVFRSNLFFARIGPILFFLLSISRFDFAIIYPVWFFSYIMVAKIENISFLKSVTSFFRRATIPLVLYTLYFLWRLYYYKAFFPNTFFAKDHDTSHAEAGIEYVVSFFKSFPFLILLCPVLLFGHHFVLSKAIKTFSLFSQIFIITYLLYLVLIGGDFMFYRFFLHIYPLFILLACFGLSALPRMNKVFLATFGGLLIWMSLAKPVLAEKYHMETLQGMYDCCTITGTKYGKILKEILPATTVISTTMAGALPYYSQLTTVDELGLTDSTVGRGSEKRDFFRRGHVKFASQEYLRNKGVNLVFGHPTECPCDDLCYENLPNVFIKVGENSCIRSHYLIQTSSLTEHFCRNKDHFILHNVSCAEK